MVGVGEDDSGAEGLEGFLGEAFYAGGGADGHEDRRLNDAVRRGQKATTRTGGISLLNFEG